MVDIGGTNGSQVIEFKTQFLHLPGRYVLQDLIFPKSNRGTKHLEGVEMTGMISSLRSSSKVNRSVSRLSV